MSSFVSRLIVSAIGLPVVLGLVYLGGWWVVGLALGAALVALHELYVMVRPLRPLVLAGYGGVALGLVAIPLGGLGWMLGGVLATLVLAFGFYVVAETRQPATVAIGSTVLGAVWIGFGLGFLVLLREHGSESIGRYAAFATLLAVWGGDSAAYLVGRLVGRHRLAPTLSPGKTWEGFVAGAAATIFIAFITLYRNDNHFLTGWRPVALGAVIAIAAVVGDLFESALKRDMEVKDTGRILGGHGGMLDRVDALLFAGPAAFFTILALS